MAKKKVAELLVLEKTGIERIYGVAGDSLNGITDTIRGRDQIRPLGAATVPLKNGSKSISRIHSCS